MHMGICAQPNTHQAIVKWNWYRRLSIDWIIQIVAVCEKEATSIPFATIHPSELHICKRTHTHTLAIVNTQALMPCHAIPYHSQLKWVSGLLDIFGRFYVQQIGTFAWCTREVPGNCLAMDFRMWKVLRIFFRFSFIFFLESYSHFIVLHFIRHGLVPFGVAISFVHRRAPLFRSLHLECALSVRVRWKAMRSRTWGETRRGQYKVFSWRCSHIPT